MGLTEVLSEDLVVRAKWTWGVPTLEDLVALLTDDILAPILLERGIDVEELIVIRRGDVDHVVDPVERGEEPSSIALDVVPGAFELGVAIAQRQPGELVVGRQLAQELLEPAEIVISGDLEGSIEATADSVYQVVIYLLDPLSDGSRDFTRLSLWSFFFEATERLRGHVVEGSASVEAGSAGSDRVFRGKTERSRQLEDPVTLECALHDLLVVDSGAELTPALHLREHPSPMVHVGKGDEVDPVADLVQASFSIGELAGEHLLRRFAVVEVEMRRIRDAARNGPTLVRVGSVQQQLGFEDGPQESSVRVRIGLGKGARRSEAATGVAGPEILGKDMNEASVRGDWNLVERLGGKDPVDPTLLQVIGHVGRRHFLDRDIRQGIQTVLGQIVAEQVVVHGEPIGHTKGEASHVVNVFDSQVLHSQRQRLPVGVLYRCQLDLALLAIDAEVAGERHGREHVCRHDLLVSHELLDAAPARRGPQVDVQPVLFEDALCMGEDERGRAEDRNEGDIDLPLFQLRSCVHGPTIPQSPTE